MLTVIKLESILSSRVGKSTLSSLSIREYAFPESASNSFLSATIVLIILEADSIEIFAVSMYSTADFSLVSSSPSLMISSFSHSSIF